MINNNSKSRSSLETSSLRLEIQFDGLHSKQTKKRNCVLSAISTMQFCVAFCLSSRMLAATASHRNRLCALEMCITCTFNLIFLRSKLKAVKKRITRHTSWCFHPSRAFFFFVMAEKTSSRSPCWFFFSFFGCRSSFSPVVGETVKTGNVATASRVSRRLSSR